MASLVRHRVRFAHHSGSQAVGVVERQYIQRMTTKDGLRPFEQVKIREGVGQVVERPVGAVLAVADRRPKSRGRRCC